MAHSELEVALQKLMALPAHERLEIGKRLIESVEGLESRPVRRDGRIQSGYTLLSLFDRRTEFERQSKRVDGFRDIDSDDTHSDRRSKEFA